MNIVFIISFPISVITSYIHLFVNSFFKIFERIYLSEASNYNHEDNTIYKKCIAMVEYLSHEKMLVLHGFLNYIFVIIFGSLLSPLVIALNLIICVLCQGILWPFIESIKAYIIVYNVIKGYGYGLKCTDNNEIQLNITTQNKKVNNSSILKTSVMANDDSNNDLRENKEKEIIINVDTSSQLNSNIKAPSLILPMSFFDDKNFFVTIIQLWRYRLKRTIIVCARWWRIIIIHTFGFYMIIAPFIVEKAYLNRYEGIRFFWWHKKTILENIAFA